MNLQNRRAGVDRIVRLHEQGKDLLRLFYDTHAEEIKGIPDQEGVIIETNHARKAFAHANRICMRPDTLGVNYVHLCESSPGDSDGQTRETACGISVLIVR